MSNAYPDWTDFNINEVIYGVGAPYVGIGVYTIDKKYSWPDPDGTTEQEYKNWESKLEALGYSVPEKYKNAFVKDLKMNLDDKKLDEIKQRSALAHKYICELAAGKHRWNMCIPPQPDDSDMALQAPIDDIKFLLEKIKRLEKAVELMREGLKEISMYGLKEPNTQAKIAHDVLTETDEILK